MKTLSVLAVLLVLFMLGIPQDAAQALKLAGSGDRMRYFKYLQTARWEGVPVALEEYGVKPQK